MHNGKLVPHVGVFEDFAVTNGVDMDRHPLDAIPRAGTSEELPAMRTTEAIDENDLVAFRDSVEHLRSGNRGDMRKGKAWVAQVDRRGCELILSSQWPDKVGKGLMFISLDVGVLDALRAELEGRGVEVKTGRWGYRLLVIADPDGNQLDFPYPKSLATDSLITSNPGH